MEMGSVTRGLGLDRIFSAQSISYSGCYLVLSRHCCLAMHVSFGLRLSELRQTCHTGIDQLSLFSAFRYR